MQRVQADPQLPPQDPRQNRFGVMPVLLTLTDASGNTLLPALPATVCRGLLPEVQSALGALTLGGDRPSAVSRPLHSGVSAQFAAIRIAVSFLGRAGLLGQERGSARSNRVRPLARGWALERRSRGIDLVVAHRRVGVCGYPGRPRPDYQPIAAPDRR
jgi:hypothetical protein